MFIKCFPAAASESQFLYQTLPFHTITSPTYVIIIKQIVLYEIDKIILNVVIKRYFHTYTQDL